MCLFSFRCLLWLVLDWRGYVHVHLTKGPHTCTVCLRLNINCTFTALDMVWMKCVKAFHMRKDYCMKCREARFPACARIPAQCTLTLGCYWHGDILFGFDFHVRE